MTTQHPFAALVRRLDAEASKAPWRIDTEYADEGGLYTYVADVDGNGVVDAEWGRCSEEDRAAIVTLRNTAPEVAALVEAAGYVVKDALRDIHTEYQMWVGEHLIDALRAALDALARAARDATSGPSDPTRIEGSPK